MDKLNVTIAHRILNAQGTPQVALRELEIEPKMPAQATIADALKAAEFTLASDATVALWGKRAELSAPLEEGARIEICGPLRCDPKVARKQRFAQKQAQMKAYRVAQALRKKASRGAL
jgi:putative ubiquitin-RnfH superfamily antitoxin RatB of RatAB toxin-antitoxin module